LPEGKSKKKKSKEVIKRKRRGTRVKNLTQKKVSTLSFGKYHHQNKKRVRGFKGLCDK